MLSTHELSPESDSKANADARSEEDQDLLERSTKKTKTTAYQPAGFVGENSMAGRVAQGETVGNGQKQCNENFHASDEAKTAPKSYKESLAGTSMGIPEQGGEVSDDEDMDGDDDPECPEIRLTKEEKTKLREPWRRLLIVKVLGRRVGYTNLCKRLQTLWHPKSKMELVALDDDYFLVKFFSLDDYEFAKYGGPWTILEHYLIVKD